MIHVFKIKRNYYKKILINYIKNIKKLMLIKLLIILLKEHVHLWKLNK